MRFLFTISFFLVSISAYCQYTNRSEYDIKIPARDKLLKECGALRSKIDHLPPEERFFGHIEGDTAYLYFMGREAFWNLFEDKKDGFALDLVNQDQYQCDNIQRISTSGSHKGFLLEPIYRDEIKDKMRVLPSGYSVVPAGIVPRNFDKSKLEVNYLIIDNQYGCYYNYNVQVESHSWDLLPMGLYYDTLYKTSMAERYRDLEKKMRFTIPFQKNTSVYKKEDIKPLYDSLKLTDFEITGIKIKSFTSVEGSLKRNIELQEERAKSIVAALQTFQPEQIKSEITSSENWVEFLEAIESTPYKNMLTLSKDEVKEALKDPKTVEKLEPILAEERKAIIELELEKRVQYSKSSPADLKKFFDQSIASKNINEALYLQEIIFHKVRRDEIEYDFVKTLEIPKAVEYGSLLLNNVSFFYEHDNHNIFEALKAFNALNELLGGNAKVEFNICALRLKAWLMAPKLSTTDDLKTKIEALQKKGIPQVLVLRLMVNYSLIQTEIFLRQGKYQEREKWLKFVVDTYDDIAKTDEDLLSLSKFLSHNARYALAAKILEARMTDIDVSEDVLFYYLSLTISDPLRTASNSYRAMMLNAVNVDRSQFCNIFNSTSKGGASFQLLEDDHLKKTWCENCNLPK